MRFLLPELVHRPSLGEAEPVARIVAEERIDAWSSSLVRASGPIASPAVTTFAVLAGLVTGTLAVLAVLPIPVPTAEERRVALVGAFVDRTVLGSIVGPVARGLGINGVLTGLVLGVAFSVGTALITRAYLPVIGLGALLGIGVGAAYEFVY